MRQLYIQSLVINLAKNGFVATEVYSSDHDQNKDIMIFIKQEAASFYIIDLIYIKKSDDTNILKEFNHSLELFNQAKVKYPPQNTVVYHILISENSSLNDNEIMESQEFYGQRQYEVFYNVHLDNQTITYDKNKVTDILKINDILDQSFSLENNPMENITEYIKAHELPVKSKFTILTNIIIFANLMMFMIMSVNGGSTNTETLMAFGAMNYERFVNGEYYRVITASFLHIGLMHLLFNTVSLHIFGKRVERYYGPLTFFVIYLCSSVVGNFANSIVTAGVLAGASSGIFGLIGGALALTQMKKKNIGGLSLYTIVIIIMVNFLFSFSMPNIGNIAHIFGLITGYLIGLITIVLKLNDHDHEHEENAK